MLQKPWSLPSSKFLLDSLHNTCAFSPAPNRPRPRASSCAWWCHFWTRRNRGISWIHETSQDHGFQHSNDLIWDDNWQADLGQLNLKDFEMIMGWYEVLELLEPSNITQYVTFIHVDCIITQEAHSNWTVTVAMSPTTISFSSSTSKAEKMKRQPGWRKRNPDESLGAARYTLVSLTKWTMSCEI